MKVLERWERIEGAGGTALAVVHDDADRVRGAMIKDLDVPFPVLVDTEREAYRAWGLQRASFWRIWLSPSTWKQYAKLLGSGERLRRAGADTLQLGGDFVVGPDGRLVYSRPQQQDDRPPVGLLVRELEGAAA